MVQPWQRLGAGPDREREPGERRGGIGDLGFVEEAGAVLYARGNDGEARDGPHGTRAPWHGHHDAPYFCSVRRERSGVWAGLVFVASWAKAQWDRGWAVGLGP